MIPPLVDGVLPPGEWEATWEELTAAFGLTPQRKHLLDGCRRVLSSLKAAGCRRVWINGSFVTGVFFVQFFQTDRNGDPKGIIVLDLEAFRP